MKKIILIIFIQIIFFSTYAQTLVSPSTIKWYSIEEGFEMFNKTPKPIMIDVYTDWCGWCKKMMASTFATQGIADYINTYFIPIRFDAETKDTIVYNDTVYTNKTGKTHDLAIKLLDGRLSYPTIIYFDKKLNKNLVPGYMDVQDIEPLLVYFVEELNNYTNYQDFNIAYMFSYPAVFSEKIKLLTDAQKPDTLGIVNWITFEEADSLNKKTPKPFLINIYIDWSNSCKIMKKSVYRNSVIAKYINDNYYAVNLNAAEINPITINGTTYSSMGAGQPHQLTMAIMQGNFYFPSTAFLSSGFQLIQLVNGYYGAVQFEPILKFLGSESYKTLDFQTYYQSFKSEINK